jgi:predicted metal-dependent phosphoesterase TrpH
VREKKADLHVHTLYSDGSFTPKEVMHYAKKVGLDCIGIADHDTVKGLEEAIGAGLALGIEVIPGVEMSAEEKGKELHILGYFINYKSRRLKLVLREIREDRKKRLHRMVDALNKHGFNINAEDIIRFAGDASISRLHIAQYMKNKGIISSWQEAFKRYIGDDKPCYVASFRLSARQAIDIIKEAGGISIIAHPGINNIDGLMPKLLKDGIDGIEVFHSEHKGPVIRHYEDFAKRHKLLITGGSDCHGTLKNSVLIGKTTIPYSYVEALKKYRFTGKD